MPVNKPAQRPPSIPRKAPEKFGAFPIRRSKCIHLSQDRRTTLNPLKSHRAPWACERKGGQKS